MKPAVKDFVSGNNEDLFAAVRLFKQDGIGFDLSVYTAISMKVRPAEFHPHVSIAMSLGDGLTTYASAGQVVINSIEFKSLVSDVDSEIPYLYGKHYYDVVGTTADGTTQRFLVGSITFEQGKSYDVSA